MTQVLQHSLIRMGLIAGIGWLLDASIYLSIAYATGYVFIANITGNCCGIVFSFVFGVRHAFSYRGAFLFKQFIGYAIFALGMTPLFSGLLAWIVHEGWLGLLGAKIAVTIPSFLANYLFLKWLIPPSSRNADHV